jgi:hypothetical protein
MRFQRSASVIAASIVTLGSVAVFITPTQAASDYRFVCKQANDGVWTTVAQTPRGPQDFIRWTSDFGGKVGYTPKRRCSEVSGRLNIYITQSNPFYLIHGKDKKTNYPIICQTDSEGKGCKGLIYTLDPKSLRPPAEVAKDLVSLVKSDIYDAPVTATSCPLYINVKALLQHRGRRPSAKYVCSSR